MSVENGEIDGLADENEKSNAAIIDEENYSHSRRQKTLEDKREHAVDVRTDARGKQIAGEITEREALQYYRGALESYILQTLPVLRHEDIDFTASYLESIRLGEVTFTPPTELQQFAEKHIERLVPGSTIPRSETYPVKGLVTIVDVPSPLSRTFSVSIRDGSGIRTESSVVKQELPYNVLDSALQAADKALEEADIGLNIDDTEEDAEFEYSYLIKGEDS